MTFFNNLKVSFKLGVLILVALLSLAAVGATGYFYLQRASKAVNTLYAERLIPVELLVENVSRARAVDGAVLELMLTTDEKKKQELKQVENDNVTKSSENMAVIEKLELDAKATEMLAKVKESRQK